MSRSYPPQLSFNAGELSPLLLARSDLAKYPSGCRVQQNMLPTVQGPGKRRGGMRFIARQKADGKVWLGRFSFSRQQSYLLEFGDQYIRFYANRAQLQVSSAPVEVATPYTMAQLTNEDGSFALSLEKSGDVIYIASGDHPLKTLRRLGATDFQLTDFATRNGPLQDQNSDKTLRLYAAARTGTDVGIVASRSYFTASMVGAFLRLDVENFTMPPWEPGKHFALDGLVRSDAKTYVSETSGSTVVTGSKTPIHEDGVVLDGSGINSASAPIGINWRFRDPGYGYAKITEFVSPTQVNVSVVDDMPFPDNVVGSSFSTNAWWIGAWGTHDGAEYPRQVCFWRNRLCLFGLRRFWMSVPQDYDNFARDIVGQVRDDSAITRPLETTERVRWVAPLDVLLVGTEGTEFIITKQTNTEPLGPNNIDATRKSFYGSRAMPPIISGVGAMIIEPSGKRVRELLYDSETGAFAAPDRTVLADHIANGTIVDWDWQQSPDSILWAVLADGQLISLTKENDNEVFAWGRQPTNGFVEAIKVIPSPDGTRDDVWLSVRRTVAGVPRRFIELMDAGDEETRSQEDCYFVDCGLTYSGPEVTELSGMDHLAGEMVDVCINGAAHPPVLVSPSGMVPLQHKTTKAHVGLGFLSIIVPMPLNKRGDVDRLINFGFRFYRTLGGKVGPSMDKLTPLIYRRGSDPLGKAPPLFSGVTEPVLFEGDYEREGTVYIVQDQPLPMTLLALLPNLDEG